MEEKNNLLQCIDVFLDPIVVIITFFLGYWISNHQTNKKENKELDALYDYFTLYLTKQKKALKAQMDYLIKQREDLSQLIPFSSLPLNLSIQPYYILDNINKEKLVQSFERKNRKGQQVIELISFIELSRAIFSKYEVYHGQFTTRQNDFQNQWNQHLKELHHDKMNLMNRPLDEIRRIPELVELNSTYNNLDRIEK
ncbi:MAG: hypothetical protein ACO1O6_11095 [Bacteroidota bacterium]